MHITTRLATATLAAATAAIIGTTASAQDMSYGQRLFTENCAACHGPEGSGDGAVAALFNAAPNSLKTLAERNNGAYPFSEVYSMISGKTPMAAHGIEMPVWGSVFREEAVKTSAYPGVTGEELVQGRILALVYYLQTIQQ